MSPETYTLDDLVRLTGFSKRQIRFYITKKLVPGAGESRGPHAVYGEETLQRLRLLGVLKEKRIEPTGRAMTLDEIGHAMDTLSADGIEALLGGHAELTVLDTESGRRQPLGSAAEYLREARADFAPGEASLLACRETRRPVDVIMGHALDLLLDGGGDIPEFPETLGDLLGRLRDLLAGLTSDSQPTDTATDPPRWLRVTTPDLEIHVREPDDHLARARLATLARQLDRLLEREE